MFDRMHIKEYPQAKLVALRMEPNAPYDGLNYRFTLLAQSAPDCIFITPKSLVDLCVETGLVTSRSKLKRLLAQGSIKAWRWHEEWEDFGNPLPIQESEFLVRKGQRVLEIVVEAQP